MNELLTISKRPEGRLRIKRNFWRHVDLTPDELHLVAQHAPPAWPDGFIDRLQIACGALLQFRNKLADSGPPAGLLTAADAAIDQFGNLVAAYGIYRPEVSDGEQTRE